MLTTIPLVRAATRVAVLTALLLTIPWAAMHWTDDVDWGAMDFALAALLLFGAGMACVVVWHRAEARRRRLMGVLLVLLPLATVWAELAVGLFH